MKYTLGILLVLMSFTANAAWSIAGGFDVKHTQDTDVKDEYMEIRYRDQLFDLSEKDWPVDSFGWSTHAGSYNSLGIGIFGTYGSFMLGWGIEHSDSRRFVSSEGAYEILLEYKISDHWAASLKHRSNCKDLCREIPGFEIFPKADSDTHNSGFNYLMVRYIF